MTLCEKIRALIPTQEKALPPAALVKALPEYPAKRVRDSVVMMFNVMPPILDRTGNKIDGFLYFVAREVQPKVIPDPDARRASRKTKDAARHASGMRVRETRAAILEEAKRRRAEQRIAEQKATEEARQAKIEAQREVWRKRKADQRAKHMSPEQRLLANTRAVPRPHRPPTKIATPQNQRRETVEEWMARTGKQPEILPPTACAEPLLRIALR